MIIPLLAPFQLRSRSGVHSKAVAQCRWWRPTGSPQIAGTALALLGLAAPAFADLDAVKTEINLERRSQKALVNADQALDTARKLYQAGELGKVEFALREVQESVELCQTSLRDTGKSPRRSPKYFKNSEIRIRGLLRRLRGFAEQMSFHERGVAEKVVVRVQQVHEELLSGIMSKKKN